MYARLDADGAWRGVPCVAECDYTRLDRSPAARPLAPASLVDNSARYVAHGCRRFRVFEGDHGEAGRPLPHTAPGTGGGLVRRGRVAPDAHIDDSRALDHELVSSPTLAALVIGLEDGLCLNASPGLARMLHTDTDALPGTPAGQWLAQSEDMSRIVGRMTAHEGLVNLEVTLLCADGQRVVTLVSGHHMRYGVHDTLLLVFVNIGPYRRRAEDANYDPLTGLPNRTHLATRLGKALESAGRRRELVALLFLDLNDFKQVNDTYGHMVGDHLLRNVALRLSGAVRRDDTVARVGGDEFVVLIESIGARAHAERVAEHLCHTLADPICVDGHEFRIGASIGIAIFPWDARHPEALMRHADAEMYRAKNGSEVSGATAKRVLAVLRRLGRRGVRRH